jgi:excisionase family DNA binding protein
MTVDSALHIATPDSTPADPVEALRDRPEAGRPSAPAPTPEPLLVPAAEVARLLGISEATLYRLKSAGKLPAPVKLGGRVLWRREELGRWCVAGCPDLRTWQALENVSGRRGTGR